VSVEGRKVAANTMFNTAGGMTVQILGLASGLFIARYFGAEGFGVLSLAAAITGYFSLITEFGLSTVAIRVVARTGAPESYLWSYLVTRMALALAALAILTGVILAIGFPSRTTRLLVAYACLIPLRILRVDWLFYAAQRMFIENLLKVIEKSVYVVTLFSLVFVTGDIVSVPVSLGLSLIITAILGWILFFRSAKRPIAWRLDRGFIREMFTHGWPIGVAGAALQSNTNIDTIFVNAYHGDVQTGLYGAAYRLIAAIIQAGTFFTRAIFPLSCKRYHESPTALADFIAYSGKLLVVITIPGVIVLMAVSAVIIRILFGDGYAGAALPFSILVWAAGLAIVSRLYHNTLVACERQQVFMKLILTSTVVNIAMNFLLIPRFGIVGAAVATVLTESLLLTMNYIALSRVLMLRGLPQIAGVIGCAGVSAGVFLLPARLIIEVPVFVATYTALLLLTRLLGPRERRLIRMLLGKTG
jgi:O-antigen/teichoic acid export membrane protein